MTNPDYTFDIILSNLGIHNMRSSTPKKEAVGKIPPPLAFSPQSLGERGVVRPARLGAAHHVQRHTAVCQPSLLGRVVGDRISLAKALGRHLIGHAVRL